VDTTVLRNNTALLVHNFGCPVCVHGYDELVAQHKHCKNVTGVLAYDHRSNGETYFLIFSSSSVDSQLESLITKPDAHVQQ
jgi:hypothetical protein